MTWKAETVQRVPDEVVVSVVELSEAGTSPVGAARGAGKSSPAGINAK